jgi:hypothetical protein
MVEKVKSMYIRGSGLWYFLIVRTNTLKVWFSQNRVPTHFHCSHFGLIYDT